MILILGLVLALAGCNLVLGLEPPAGGDGGAGDGGAGDGGASDGGDGDRDGDQIPDDVDVCPDTPDPAQHDEDGDGRGDACDRCPHLFQEPTQEADLDRDGDGVPDVCDPLPDTPGGRLRFWGFNDQADVGGWRTFGQGTAIVASGAVVLTPTIDGELRFSAIDDGRRSTRVEARLTLGAHSPGGGSTRRAAGVLSNLDTSPEQNHFRCQLEGDVPVTQSRLALSRQSTSGESLLSVAVVQPDLPVGSVRLALEAGIGPSTYGVACRLDVGQASAELPRTGSTELAAGEAGVRTVGIPLRIEWLAIVDHP